MTRQDVIGPPDLPFGWSDLNKCYCSWILAMLQETACLPSSSLPENIIFEHLE